MPEGGGAQLARAARQPPHVVQAGELVQQALVARPVGVELGAHVGVEAQRQLLAVERGAEEVPGAGAQRGEALLAARMARARDEDRGAVADERIVAERPADLEAVDVGEVGVDDDDVRPGAAATLQRLLAGVGPQDRVAVGSEDALQ